MMGTTIDGAAPGRPPEVRPPRRLGLVLKAVVVAVILAAGGGYWATHPHALGDYGGDTQSGPVARGRVFDDVMLSPGSGSARRPVVTVTSLRPRIEENTAGAVILLLLCRTDVANPNLTLIGDPKSPAHDCSPLRPLRHSERMALNLPHTRVIAQITTSRPGRLYVAGYDITYRQGIRWGHQHVGINSDFTIS